MDTRDRHARAGSHAGTHAQMRARAMKTKERGEGVSPLGDVHIDGAHGRPHPVVLRPARLVVPATREGHPPLHPAKVDPPQSPVCVCGGWRVGGAGGLVSVAAAANTATLHSRVKRPRTRPWSDAASQRTPRQRGPCRPASQRTGLAGAALRGCERGLQHGSLRCCRRRLRAPRRFRSAPGAGGGDQRGKSRSQPPSHPFPPSIARSLARPLPRSLSASLRSSRPVGRRSAGVVEHQVPQRQRNLHLPSPPWRPGLAQLALHVHRGACARHVPAGAGESARGVLVAAVEVWAVEAERPRGVGGVDLKFLVEVCAACWVYKNLQGRDWSELALRTLTTV